MNKYNYKAVFDYSPPDDRAIENMMDFEKIEESIKPNKNFFTRNHLIVSSIVVAALTILWFFLPKNHHAESITNLVEKEVQKENIITDPVIDKKEIKTILKKEIKKNILPKELEPQVKQKTTNKKSKKKVKEKKQKLQQNENVIIENLENQFIDAHPIVGFDSLYQYFKQALEYPLQSPADTIEGSVEVQFTINKDGKVVKPIIIQSLGESFDIEAIRVIKEMPEWNAATVNGMPMLTKKQIAIHFNKQKDNNHE